MSKIFIDACFKKPTPYTPVWMMRQAGRYLPEYMRVREEAGSFLELCHDPKKACEVTLQPVDIVGVDAAILFSDILVIPDEMGMDLEFIKGRGPIFNDPIREPKDIDRLDINAADKLTYVYDAIKLIKEKLSDDKALIGFSGSPWTNATYMIEGQGTKTYEKCKKLIYTQPKMMHSLLQKLTEVTKLYLEKQIQAGVDVVQVFDSWAGALERDAYFEFSWAYMVEIAEYIKEKYPNIPVILFPKGIGQYLDGIYGNFDVFGVDWSTPIELALEKLGDKYVLQGNMEPTRLYSKDATTKAVESIHSTMSKHAHIFNLGHGILPDVPVEHAKHFIQEVHRVSQK